MPPPRIWPGGCPGAVAGPSELLSMAHPAPFESLTADDPLLPTPGPHPGDTPIPSIPRAAGEGCLLLQYRLARLTALATRADAGATSSATTSSRHQRQGCDSPRITKGTLNVQEGGGQKSKKRKSPCGSMRNSPCGSMPPFPLSRRLLSPSCSVQKSSIRKSPCGSMRKSPCHTALGDIDLNVTLENSPAPLGRGQRVMSEIDLNVALENSPEILHHVTSSIEQNGDDLDDQDYGSDDGPVGEENARRNLLVTDEKRRLIFEALLGRATNGNLNVDVTKEISSQFSVPIRTIQRIWKRGKSCLDQGLVVDVSSGKKRCGRKKKEVDVSKLRDVPLLSRTTVHGVAKQLGVSKAKVHRMKKEGVIKRVSNSIKPYLTDNNKKDCLRWCLSMLDPRSVPNDPVFKGLFDYVFIDEKWFYITKKTLRYYTVPGEEQPTRTCKNKNYIPKIQILTAVARPRFDTNGDCTFDGKISCFPFVTYEPAERKSHNRLAGTIEMKPIKSIKKVTIQDFMIQKVVPAIRARWPLEDASKPIYIQQDNAKPHLSPNDRQFCEAARQDGFDMRLICQPANSPDFNILDLGFFNSIQSIQDTISCKTTEELLTAVNLAFEDYSPGVLNRIFLTLQGCLKEVMKIGGGNGYDIPHMRKEMLERQGCLPLQLKCEASLVEAAAALISE